MKNEKLNKKIKDLPKNPGVYIFFGPEHKVIYVGKAVNLKKRVSGYFLKSASHGPRIRQMVGKIKDLELIITENEAKALVLENNLIKKYFPKYNVAYKDDKTYPYIKITREDFPSISLVRIPPSEAENGESFSRKAFFFGPYPKVEIVKQAIKKIRYIFPLRNCKKEIHPDKPFKTCLDYQIGNCSGPCNLKITQYEYKKLAANVVLLLRGKKKKLFSSLKKEMKFFSSQLKFEEAAKVRNQFLGLKEIIDIKDADRADRPIKRVLRGPESNVHKSGLKQNIQLLALQSALGLKFLPFRIECFDISNVSGEYSVGSVIVFKNGLPSNKDYRQFKIKTVSGINDTEMIKEVAGRRYGKMSEGHRTELPDLIVVDGGAGQLNALSRVLEEIHLNIPAIGLAKRLEEIIRKDPAKIIKIVLEKSSPALHLLQYLRDEAHRFALRYHKILRHRSLRKSFLDKIPGIGAKRKQKLINFFGSADAMKKASIEELREAGISRNIALKILGTN